MRIPKCYKVITICALAVFVFLFLGLFYQTVQFQKAVDESGQLRRLCEVIRNGARCGLADKPLKTWTGVGGLDSALTKFVAEHDIVYTPFTAHSPDTLIVLSGAVYGYPLKYTKAEMTAKLESPPKKMLLKFPLSADEISAVDYFLKNQTGDSSAKVILADREMSLYTDSSPAELIPMFSWLMTGDSEKLQKVTAEAPFRVHVGTPYARLMTLLKIKKIGVAESTDRLLISKSEDQKIELWLGGVPRSVTLIQLNGRAADSVFIF